MKNIPIKNKEVLAALKDFEWYYDNKDWLKEHLRVSGSASDREYFVSETHRDEIIKQDHAHEGYPDTAHFISLKNDRLDIQQSGVYSTAKHSSGVVDIYKKFGELNTNLCTLLSTRNNALCSLYPPNGFISWHNNANASAYNLIFTWSETGEGCFKYVDGHTGKTIVMQDEKGWQCKAGYFGAYHEPWYNRVYHAAETDCWRMTISYIFDRTDMSMGLQDEIIEEIMSDY